MREESRCGDPRRYPPYVQDRGGEEEWYISRLEPGSSAIFLRRGLERGVFLCTRRRGGEGAVLGARGNKRDDASGSFSQKELKGRVHCIDGMKKNTQEKEVRLFNVTNEERVAKQQRRVERALG